jgi:hypothetical protein
VLQQAAGLVPDGGGVLGPGTGGELLHAAPQVVQHTGAPLEVVHHRECVRVRLVTGGAVVAGGHRDPGSDENDLAGVAAQ